MAEIFPSLVENTNLHIEESKQTPRSIKTKTLPRHIRVKLPKTKRESLERSQEKQHITHKGTIQVMADVRNNRDKTVEHLSRAKRKERITEFYNQHKYSSNDDGEIKTSSDKQNLRIYHRTKY